MVKNIDLDNSKLTIELKGKELEAKQKQINARVGSSEPDRNKRKKEYKRRREFFAGKHESYTNIIGLTQKSKKGHADQVVNLAGKSITKIYHSISNTPPQVKVLPLDQTDDLETLNAQAVEDFQERVFWKNKFWKRGFKRATLSQCVDADFALKVYLDPSDNEIKVISAEKMENVAVGWRSDDALEYDWVAHRELMSVSAIKNLWGIEVKPDVEVKGQESSGSQGDEWGAKSARVGEFSSNTQDEITEPMAYVTEYADDKAYAILIDEQIVSYVVHEYGFNPWVIGHSLHIPGKAWSKGLIDDLMSPNVELNEVLNDDRDYIRTASNSKFIARNMSDFNPESIKPGSGQVIFVDGPDSDFSTLGQTVNTYPVDTYIGHIKGFIHDLLVPAVGFGSGGADSGRSKAIDFQTIVDVTDDLRIAWELVLDGVTERIQKLGQKYFGGDYWMNPNGEFEVRMCEYSWTDIVPISASDKIVDVLNKFSMGLPFAKVWEELGYKDPQAIIELMKKEAEDPLLTAYRSKMYNLLPGIQQGMVAQQQAMTPEVPGGVPGAPEVNQAAPTLTTSENQNAQPVSVAGGTTSTSTPGGLIAQARQNLLAQQG